MRRIAVLGAGGSAATNFIKSLRHAPEDFYIVGTDCSKYYAKLSQADKTYVLPHCTSPGTSPDYLEKLNEIIIGEGIEFMHAQPDPEVAFISEHRDLIKADTFLPDARTIRIAQNKYRLNVLLRDYNVPAPPTEKVIDSDNLRVLMKTNKKKLWLRAMCGAGSLAALPVSSYEQAYYWIEYWIVKGLHWKDFIISDFLPGKEYAFQSIWNDGNLITSAARERLEYLFQARMPSGQSSTPTVAKSVHNKLVNGVARNAVKALDNEADGIFCVDLKENEDGIPNVTEVNAGRFFTTSNFFTLAGSNMPYYYVLMGYGEILPKLPMYDAVPKDLFFVRQMDCGSTMFHELELDNNKGEDAQEYINKLREEWKR